MSKYGNLRKGEGHSKFFLTRTLAEHDDTMDHPLMKKIYEQEISEGEFCRYLAGQFHLFSALDAAVLALKDVAPLSAVFDPAIERRECLLHDLQHHCGARWASRPELASPSPATQRLLDQLQLDAESPRRLLCHHFLQYNAVLSGGHYLKRMLNKKFGEAESNKAGVEFFTFSSIPSSKQAGYVQGYCQKLDGLELTQKEREEMLASMKLIYKLTLETMDEIEPRGEALQQQTVWTEELEPELCELPLEALHLHNGAEGARVLLSVRGRILDASKNGEAYGPGGNYHMLAGRDVTKSLTTMSLDTADLDTVDWAPETEEQQAALSRWEARLSGQYAVVGSLRGDARRELELAPDTTEPLSAESAAAVAAGAACPFTGTVAAEGEECPLRGLNPFGGKAEEEAGSEAAPAAECPWPFILLHAPAHGFAQHTAKTLALAATVAAVVVPRMI